MTPDSNRWYQGSGERELVPGFLRGYRYWYLDTDEEEPVLRSLHKGAPELNWGLDGGLHIRNIWAPGVNTAGCFLRDRSFTGTSSTLEPRYEYAQRHSHQAPRAGCSCGFYGRYDSRTYSYINSEWADGISPWVIGAFPAVFGTFKATGRIVLGDIGFKAEKVEVEAIAEISMRRVRAWIMSFDGQVVRDLFDDYDTPAMAKHRMDVDMVSRRYGVPAFDSVQDLLQHYPRHDVSALIGPRDELGNPVQSS